MPIQFRCSSCKQLLGIARRKAGASVTCPTCGAKTMVPNEAEAVAVGAAEKAAGNARPLPTPRKRAVGGFSLLERVDVDELLKAPEAPDHGPTERPTADVLGLVDSAKTAALDSSEEPVLQRVVPPRKQVPRTEPKRSRLSVVLIVAAACVGAVGLLAAGWYLGRRGP